MRHVYRFVVRDPQGPVRYSAGRLDLCVTQQWDSDLPAQTAESRIGDQTLLPRQGLRTGQSHFCTAGFKGSPGSVKCNHW